MSSDRHASHHVAGPFQVSRSEEKASETCNRSCTYFPVCLSFQRSLRRLFHELYRGFTEDRASPSLQRIRADVPVKKPITQSYFLSSFRLLVVGRTRSQTTKHKQGYIPPYLSPIPGHRFPGVIRVRRRERRRPEGFSAIQDELFEYRLRVEGTSRSSAFSLFA